jgi:hypothetical protein
MALSFKKLKSPLLDMTDTITVGKLQGCRVCDVIPDHYEYLIWANKQGFLPFSKIVTETISEHAGYKRQQVHIAEEVDPYLKEYNEPSVQELNFSEEDIPF